MGVVVSDITSDMSTDELAALYMETVENMLALNTSVENKIRRLEEKEQQHHAASFNVDGKSKTTTSKTAAQSIEVNVGGKVFHSTVETLVRCEYFHHLFVSGSSGPFFIDRDPDNFTRIVAAVRTGASVDFEGLTADQAACLREDMEYYFSSAHSGRELIRWSQLCCNSDLSITEEGRTVTMTAAAIANGVRCLTSTPDAPRFSVRIHADNELCIGFIKSNATRQHIQAYTAWALDFDGDVHTPVGYRTGYCRALQWGDLVTGHLDKDARTISFSINGYLYGVAVSNVDCNSGPLFPYVELYSSGDYMSLED